MRQIAMLLVAVLFCGWALVGQAREPEPPERYSLHEVQPGDTLWSISQKYIPEVDPRIAVEWILEANGLDTAIIHPGDILNVPDFDGALLEPLGPWYSCPEAAEAAEREFQELLREKRPQPAARGATTRTMTVEATAYCPCRVCTGKGPEHPVYGITASGAPAVNPGPLAPGQVREVSSSSPCLAGRMHVYSGTGTREGAAGDGGETQAGRVVQR